MPKKKGRNKSFPKDVTLSYYANVEKPSNKPKKVTIEPKIENIAETAWDEIPDDAEINIVGKVNSEGKFGLQCTKNKTLDISNSDNSNSYPEILWYLISRSIDPEDTGRFALINKVTWAVTHQKSFWMHLYEKYCKYSLLLPSQFKIEDDPKMYGLKTRVILALHNTHEYFMNKVMKVNRQDVKAQQLVEYQCVSFDYIRSTRLLKMFFKFRKKQTFRRVDTNFMRELDRLDANPEQNVKLLQINFQAIGPNTFKYIHQLEYTTIGMTLDSIKMSLCSSLCAYKVVLHFTNRSYVNKSILPELVFPLEPVKNIRIYEWWHPNYPSFHIGIPYYPKERGEDEDEPVLERDFFAPRNNNIQFTDDSVLDQSFIDLNDNIPM